MKFVFQFSPKLSVIAVAGSLGLTAASGLISFAQENGAQAPSSPAQAGEGAGGTPVAFPSKQVRQGRLVFQDNCASCHGPRLDGSLENPALKGDAFKSHWAGQPVSGLYDYISQYMPLDRPGALKPEEYAAVMAFVLSENNIKPSDDAEPLSSDASQLSKMVIPQ